MKIVQIVPRFLPQVCGVGDYARILGERLEVGHGLTSQFAVSSPLWGAPGPASPPAFSLARSAALAGRQLSDAAEQAAGIVVQYSGYGLAARGAPLWLPFALRRCRRRYPGVPIHTMFHEVTARGSWRSSSFWNWPLQRWIVAELVKLSSGSIFTNLDVHSYHIRRIGKMDGRAPMVLPVFSNLGEMDGERDREPSLAFFGWDMSPARGSELCHWLEAAIRSFGIQTLHVFRHPLPANCKVTIPVETHGVMEEGAVSAILGRCRYAFHDYIPQFLGKSGLFAAYAAHQLVTILRGGVGDLPGGLRVGCQVLSLADPGTFGDSVSQDGVAAALRQWYRPHDRAATASQYAIAIQEAFERWQGS